VDLDLAQVRAFVATADNLHFGRAAEQLSLSQQALSKRIARLETRLGTRLFERGNGPVTLTRAGRRFLDPARRLLAAEGAAMTALRADDDPPLCIDVWGHLYGPARTVRQVVDRLPEVGVEIGMARDLPDALVSLRSGEIHAGFGRIHPTGHSLVETLTDRLVRVEPVDAILGADHPLADATALRPADLRDSMLWFPAPVGRLDFLRRFADHFGILGAVGGVNLGIEHFLEQIRADPARFSIFPADMPLPNDPGIRSVPLVEPTPLYAWSLIWPEHERHPRLDALLRACVEVGRDHRWLVYDPERDWLPDTDLATLGGTRERANNSRRQPGVGPIDLTGST
jgi:DNA-binding transcriptional LysR family regulator